jgi:Flp pilus assembly protein TadD
MILAGLLTLDKKRANLEPEMRANLRLFGSLAAAGILLAGGCTAPRTMDQMKIGLWASSQKLWDEAIFRWQRVLESKPNSAAAHNNLAVAYETKGLWEDARREYEAALKIDPQNSLIQSNFSQFKQNLEGKDSRKPEPLKKESHEK